MGSNDGTATAGAEAGRGLGQHVCFVERGNGHVDELLKMRDEIGELSCAGCYMAGGFMSVHRGEESKLVTDFVSSGHGRTVVMQPSPRPDSG